MYQRNDNGPSILPWGTTDVTGRRLEMAPFTRTHWVLLVR